MEQRSAGDTRPAALLFSVAFPEQVEHRIGRTGVRAAEDGVARAALAMNINEQAAAKARSRHARRGATNFQRRYARNAAGSVSESAVTSSAITSVGSIMGTGSNPAAFSAR